MAYFLREEALGDSLLEDFFRVPQFPGPPGGSSIEELLGRAVFDKSSIPFPFPIHKALPLPVKA